MRYLAFVDESESRQASDPGTYILSATICSESLLEITRDSMRLLKPVGAHKLHWHVAGTDRKRIAFIASIAALEIRHLIVVRQGNTSTRPERRRRLCLQRMLFELQNLNVSEVIAEARGSSDDRRDRNLLDGLRAQRLIGSSLRFSHAPGPSDPMLWIPDFVCGAMTRERGGDSRFLNLLRESTTVITIDDR